MGGNGAGVGTGVRRSKVSCRCTSGSTPAHPYRSPWENNKRKRIKRYNDDDHRSPGRRNIFQESGMATGVKFVSRVHLYRPGLFNWNNNISGEGRGVVLIATILVGGNESSTAGRIRTVPEPKRSAKVRHPLGVVRTTVRGCRVSEKSLGRFSGGQRCDLSGYIYMAKLSKHVYNFGFSYLDL